MAYILSKQQISIYEQITDKNKSKPLIAKKRTRQEFVRDINKKIFQIEGAYEHMMSLHSNPTLYDAITCMLVYIHIYNYPLFDFLEKNKYLNYLSRCSQNMVSVVRILFSDKQDLFDMQFSNLLLDTFYISLEKIFTETTGKNHIGSLYGKIQSVNGLKMKLKRLDIELSISHRFQQLWITVSAPSSTNPERFVAAFSEEYLFYHNVPHMTLSMILDKEDEKSSKEKQLKKILDRHFTLRSLALEKGDIIFFGATIGGFLILGSIIYCLFQFIWHHQDPLWLAAGIILAICYGIICKSLMAFVYSYTRNETKKNTSKKLTQLNEQIIDLSTLTTHKEGEIEELEDGYCKYPLHTYYPLALNNNEDRNTQPKFETTSFPKTLKRHQLPAPKIQEEPAVKNEPKGKGKQPGAEAYQKHGLWVKKASNRAGTFVKKYYFDPEALSKSKTIGTNLPRYLETFKRGKIVANAGDSGFKAYSEGLSISSKKEHKIFTTLKVTGGDLSDERVVAHLQEIGNTGKVREVFDEHVDKWHKVIDRQFR